MQCRLASDSHLVVSSQFPSVQFTAVQDHICFRFSTKQVITQIIKLFRSPGVCVKDETTCIPVSYAHLTVCVSLHPDFLCGLAIESHYCKASRCLIVRLSKTAHTLSQITLQTGDENKSVLPGLRYSPTQLQCRPASRDNALLFSSRCLMSDA